MSQQTYPRQTHSSNKGCSKIFAISLAGLVAATPFAFTTPVLEDTHQVAAQISPESFGVQSLQLINDQSGIATIKMDSFRINVSFDFESFQDSYGVPGSEFTAVLINNLKVDSITDESGDEFSDFTDHYDHRNINQLIATYIEKKGL